MLFIEIIVWIAFSLFWIRKILLFTTKTIPAKYFTWIGGWIWLFLVQREVWFILQSLVNKGLPFYISILLLPLTFCLLWYAITNIISAQHLTWIGGITFLFINIYLCFKVIQIRYPVVQWDSAISFLASFLSLQSTFGRWLTEVVIPVSIPLSIALWGWLGQKQQNKIAKQYRNEEILKTYFDDMLEVSSKINNLNMPKTTAEIETLIVRAKVKTSSVFKNLGDYKLEKRRVLEFLYDAGLIKNRKFSLLEGVDFESLNLRNIYLEGANLSEANFRFCDFSFSNLSNTYLNKSRFSVCIFKEANLTNADCRFSCFNTSLFYGGFLPGRHFIESFRGSRLFANTKSAAMQTSIMLSSIKRT